MNPLFFDTVGQLLQSLSQTAGETFMHTHFVLHALDHQVERSIALNTTARQHIHIHEDQWNKQEQIIISRLHSLAGLGKRFHARAGVVKRIDKATADAFLTQNHLQGTTGAYYKAGLFYQEELIAVATFSKSRTMHDGPALYRSYEWERFATKNGTAVIGGIGKLLSWFIQLVEPAHIMTYIDLDWGDGKGFQALGFKATDWIAPNRYEVNPLTWQRTPLAENQISRPGFYTATNTGSRKFILDRRVLNG